VKVFECQRQPDLNIDVHGCDRLADRAGSGSAGSATATVTVSNVGKGNLATGGPTKASNLDGKIGPISGAKWNGPGVTSHTLCW
jgi:hypothetical protein